MRERSSPSTRNTATCPFSSASAAMRRGSTATPRPRVAAFTSASVLVDSHTGATVKPAAAAALSNCSRVPLPFSRSRKRWTRKASSGTVWPCVKGRPGAQTTARVSAIYSSAVSALPWTGPSIRATSSVLCSSFSSSCSDGPTQTRTSTPGCAARNAST